jgi:Plasma-membrane choline transporter
MVTGCTGAGNYQRAVTITTYVLAACTVIVLLLTLLMVRRIKIAIACLKVRPRVPLPVAPVHHLLLDQACSTARHDSALSAGHRGSAAAQHADARHILASWQSVTEARGAQVAAAAVGTMPSLLLFPLITFALFLGLFAYWVWIFAYQWSAGALVPTVDSSRAAPQPYSLAWMSGGAGGANGTLASDAPVGEAAPEGSNGMRPCYDDPNCYYDVQFSQAQMVRAAARMSRRRLHTCDKFAFCTASQGTRHWSAA